MMSWILRSKRALLRPATALSVSALFWRNMRAISSVVVNETLTPVAAGTRSGSTVAYLVGSMGAWPCFDATMIKLSS